MFEIYDKKCEFQVNPIGLACDKPRFSWKLPYTQAQRAYRLAVSSCRELALSGVGDLCDSGRVESPEPFAEYAGEKLASRQRCFWRVTVFTDSEEVPSEVCSFEMGLLEKSDWKGNWVSMPVKDQGGTALYRKKISLKDKPIAAARAYFCGVGYSELFVNGNKISDDVLSPALSEYSRRLFYCSYDIFPQIRPGDNVLGFELGHGWYGGKRAIAQFYFDYADGETEEYHSSTNGGWWVTGSPTTDNSVYGGEDYDARLESRIPKNWCTCDFEPAWDNGWMFTIFAASPEAPLEPQTIEPIKVNRIYPSVSVAERSESVKIVDIGRNISGWARIWVRGERGSKITLKFGERLTADGYVNRCNLRSARAADIYTLKGEGVEEYAPRFTYHGFQYIQAEIEGNAELLSVQGEHVHTSVKVCGSFDCSDETLNRMHGNAVVTELNNQHGILTDCPQRDERFGWLNDLGSRLYQTVYNCSMERFFPKFTRDITHTQLETGAIGDTAPFYTGGRPADPVCIAYLLMPLMSYTYYGDRRLAEEEFENNKKWVDFLLSCSNDSVMNYSYYADWVAPDCFKTRTGNIYVSTAYLFWHLETLSKLAKIVGRTAEAQVYAEKADTCRLKINEVFFNPETCNYDSGTQAANSIALSLGIVPEKFRAKVAANVVQNVRDLGWHSSCGNVGYRHLFYVLGDYGYTEDALKMLKNPDYPGWGFMLANGATSVWERWESEMSNEMDSFNHPMFGSYDAFFYHFLGGIRIDGGACACDSVTIEPVTASGLDYVNCSLDTVRGKIVSNWRREGNKIAYRIEIPSGAHATLKLGGETFERTGGSYEFML